MAQLRGGGGAMVVLDWLDPSLRPYAAIVHEYGVEDLDDLLLLDKVHTAFLRHRFCCRRVRKSEEKSRRFRKVCLREE